MKLEYSQYIFEKFLNIKVIKICPVEAKRFHTEGQTDMMKLIVTFHNFANMPKNNIWMSLCYFNFYLFYDLRKKYL